jgi:hypothetical protein
MLQFANSKENPMTVKKPGRALVALALLMTSVPMASDASYFPTARHLIRSQTRTHHASVDTARKAPSSAQDPNHDPLADIWLG